MRPWPALLCVAFLLPVPAGGQPVTRRAFVDATHASGGAVLDLKPADFQITEAGAVCDVSSATLTQRPTRIVLMVDATDAVRQPIGQIRTAITTFLEAVDAENEMMFVTVAGTLQIRVAPTKDRAAMIKAARNLFGTSGASTMYRHVDDIFHRFGQTTGQRPVFVLVTAERYESTENINPQEIKHISDHFIARGGTLHSVRLRPTTAQTLRGGNVTALPVTQIVARDTGGAYTDTSPAGLLETLQRLADVINSAHASAAMVYEVEYTGPQIKGRKPTVPDVRVDREGIQLKVFASP
jgi:hypothetical protein